VFDGVVVDAEVVLAPVVDFGAGALEPHAVRTAATITMLAATRTSRGGLDTSRTAQQRGRCEGEVTIQSVSAAPPPVIGREEASPLPRATYTSATATPGEVLCALAGMNTHARRASRTNHTCAPTTGARRA
jgi:hypothetical protein